MCRKELVMDATETDDESLVGEACHIVAQSDDGPRGDSPISPEQRDKFANLILLCNIHHKQIDDQFIAFPVERLLTIKSDHEIWVRAQLGFDAQKQRDDETYAGYIEEWGARLELDDWRFWASAIMCNGRPSLRNDRYLALQEIRVWLLSRVWPKRYVKLEAALTNFRMVAQDFGLVFNKHAKPFGKDSSMTDNFYQHEPWDEERERKLLAKFEAHVGLVEDLMLELTRAVNYVCDMVRSEFLPSYRVHEGIALIDSGPYSDFRFKTFRVEYLGTERTEQPYPGLTEFKKVRFSRDLCIGHEADEA